jgi:hypothetical protein
MLMLVMVRQHWQIDLEDLGTPWVKKTTALGRGWRRRLTPSISGELLGFSDLGWSGGDEMQGRDMGTKGKKGGEMSW